MVRHLWRIPQPLVECLCLLKARLAAKNDSFLVERPLDISQGEGCPDITVRWLGTVEHLQRLAIHPNQLQFCLLSHHCHKEQPLSISRDLRVGDGDPWHFDNLRFLASRDIIALQCPKSRLIDSPSFTV